MGARRMIFEPPATQVPRYARDDTRHFRLARHLSVLPRVIPPGHSDARRVEDDEADDRGGRASGVGDRGAEALRNEEAAVRTNGRAETEDRGRFLGVEDDRD